MHEQRYNEIAPRGARRRRRDYLLMTLRVAAALLSAALLVELACAVVLSPRFRVRQVKLLGVRTLDAGAVLSRAGIGADAKLGAISTGKIRRRLAAIPAVDSVAVARDWPGTLVIVIRERIPAAFVRCGAGIVLLDRQGIAFTADRMRAEGLPELRGVTVHLGKLGRRQDCTALRSAMAALTAAQEAELTVGEAVVRGPSDLELRLADGTRLRLGRAEHLRLKLSQAKVALMQLQPLHEVEYVDVSCPDAAVWKPRVKS
ncbi:MAG: FtsQ-type POTRA domain-containing protein [Armatimonadota bacterium]|nr:MAG: FtsQ-type POTRA domain-containing protein [Armatimonadota bacterium]